MGEEGDCGGMKVEGGGEKTNGALDERGIDFNSIWQSLNIM